MADSTVRQGIRNALDLWTAKLECDGDAEKKLWYKQKFIKNLKQMPIAIQTDLANEQHYEVSRFSLGSSFILIVNNAVDLRHFFATFFQILNSF